MLSPNSGALTFLDAITGRCFAGVFAALFAALSSLTASAAAAARTSSSAGSGAAFLRIRSMGWDIESAVSGVEGPLHLLLVASRGDCGDGEDGWVLCGS